MPLKSRKYLRAVALLCLVPWVAPVFAQTGFTIGGVEVDASLTLDGIYANRFKGKESEPAGFGDAGHDDHGHDHGHAHSHGLKNGFNAGHSEIGLRARTDLFDAVLMIGFDDRDVEVEEAYLVTRALPAGLRLKAGKFLSDIGYMNSRHPHDWSFIERPLVNQYLFGDHGLQERGVQLGYTAATTDYLAFGIEVLQGNGEGQNRFDDGAFKRERSGPRMATAFAKYGPDLGDRHAVQFGVSTGMSRQYARVDGHDDHRHSVEGDGWFAGIDAMYRYDAGRAYGVGNWRVGGEYYYTQRSVRARGYSDARGWRENPARFTEKQDGLYVELVHGFAPRWEAGIRAEALGLTNQVVKFHPTQTATEDTSHRYSAQVTWRPRETIFVRGQLSREEFAGMRAHGHGEGDHSGRSWMFMLQLNAVLGSHPAHRF